MFIFVFLGCCVAVLRLGGGEKAPAGDSLVGPERSKTLCKSRFKVQQNSGFPNINPSSRECFKMHIFQ